MDCYRVRVPDGAAVAGVTAAGQPAVVRPGEYLVHRLRPRAAPGAPALLRFVGADAAGRDVHVRMAALRGLPVERVEAGGEPALAA